MASRAISVPRGAKLLFELSGESVGTGAVVMARGSYVWEFWAEITMGEDGGTEAAIGKEDEAGFTGVVTSAEG